MLLKILCYAVYTLTVLLAIFLAATPLENLVNQTSKTTRETLVFVSAALLTGLVLFKAYKAIVVNHQYLKITLMLAAYWVLLFVAMMIAMIIVADKHNWQ